MVSSTPNEQDNTIASSDAAYDAFKLQESRSILETILAVDTIQDEIKCKALLKLAHQDWKYYKDYALAKGRLLQADSLGREKYETWMLFSRIERESQHYNDALEAALKAKALAQSKNEANKADTEYANGVYTASIDQLNRDQTLDTAILTQTTKLLSEVLETDAGLPRSSKLLLGIALLNNDGENVMKAWQSYFQIQDSQVNAYLKTPANKLNHISKNWNGNKLSTADQEVLIESLGSSRFYELIPVYVQKNEDTSDFNPTTRDFIIYSQYLQEVEKETNE